MHNKQLNTIMDCIVIIPTVCIVSGLIIGILSNLLIVLKDC